MSAPVYVLGGAQTDFARTWSRDGLDLFDIARETIQDTLAATRLDAGEVEVVHVGNFTAELFRGQGLLGGLAAAAHPDLDGLPTSRHEAACASGSMAVLAALADIGAGHYDVALVVGLEEMRNVPGDVAADHLGAAAWRGREAAGARYLWPHMFSRLVDEYDRRYGIDDAHLHELSRLAFDNARRNPNAHTRRWQFSDASFSCDDAANPVVEGRIRRQACGQISDGGAAVVLASARFAERWAARRAVDLAAVPVVRGWGHRTGTMLLEDKLRASAGTRYVFPHIRDVVADAHRRAGVSGIDAIDAVELHDCFAITAYMLIEHLGIAPPGEARRAIEAGDVATGGRIPINPSGGLIGAGHPVGATGVRMVLDAARQVTGTAGDYQVAGARTVQTLNIGGSATAVASFVIGTLP